MGLPVIGVVVKIDPVEVIRKGDPADGFKRLDLVFDLAVEMPLWVAPGMRRGTRPVAVRREREFGIS